MASQIYGLELVENFITSDQEKQLLDLIDSPQNTWNTKLKIRTMHFGYEYNYSGKDILNKSRPIPNEFEWLIELVSKKVPADQPINQIIINEYLPGQGITSHIDSDKFGDVIVSLSLNSDCLMEFVKISMTKTTKVDVLLKRCSAIYLKEESRNRWQHGIKCRKNDKLSDGTILKRDRRVSITFRHAK